MKKILLIGMVFITGAILLSFSLESDLPGPDADALWNYITQVSPYKEWRFWNDHSGMQPGRSPHGPFHKVFVNDILIDATDVPVPYGSIQVKESFDNDKNMTSISVMYKVKDYNPEAGDWYWVKYSLDGQGSPSGKVQGCIGCHAVRADNDYITVHNIKR